MGVNRTTTAGIGDNGQCSAGERGEVIVTGGQRTLARHNGVITQVDTGQGRTGEAGSASHATGGQLLAIHKPDQ